MAVGHCHRSTPFHQKTASLMLPLNSHSLPSCDSGNSPSKIINSSTLTHPSTSQAVAYSSSSQMKTQITSHSPSLPQRQTHFVKGSQSSYQQLMPPHVPYKLSLISSKRTHSHPTPCCGSTFQPTGEMEDLELETVPNYKSRVVSGPLYNPNDLIDFKCNS